MVGVLLSLLGSKLSEVGRQRPTIFVTITIHTCPEVVSIWMVFADQMLVLHPFHHSTSAVLTVLSDDRLLKRFHSLKNI